jgi:hypothetical protein
MHVFTFTHTQAWMHECACERMSVRICAYMRVCICMCINPHTCVFDVCMHVCMYKEVYVCSSRKRDSAPFPECAQCSIRGFACECAYVHMYSAYIAMYCAHKLYIHTYIGRTHAQTHQHQNVWARGSEASFDCWFSAQIWQSAHHTHTCAQIAWHLNAFHVRMSVSM